MDSWKDILYDAKKDFYKKSPMSPEHVKLKKALEIVEKEINPISRELDDKKKEAEHLKAALADASTQLRLARYQKDNEIDQIKKESAEKISERLEEKELLFQTNVKQYEQRIAALRKALQEAQTFTHQLQEQKRHIEYSSTQNIQKILDNERLEQTLVLKRKDEEIQSFQDRLIQKEDYIKQLSVAVRELETRHFESQKQWVREVQFSREILKKTIEEMDNLQREYVNRESELINELQKEIIDSKKHLSYLEKDHPEQRANLLKLELDEKETLLKHAEEEISLLHGDLEKVYGELHVQREPTEQFLTEQQKLRNRITELENANKTLQGITSEHNKKIAQKDHDVEVYKHHITVLEASTPTIDPQKLNELEKFNAALKSEKEILHNQINNKDQAIAQLNTQIKELQEKQHTSERMPMATTPDASPDQFNFIPYIPSDEPSDAPDSDAPDKERTAVDKHLPLPAYKRIITSRRLGIAAVFLAIVAGIFMSKQYQLLPLLFEKTSKTVDQSFKATQQNPSALIWDGLTFWSTDWFSKKIFKHKPHSLTEFSQTTQLENIIPTSLTWGEGNLWVSDAWSRKVFRLSLDDHFTIEAEYPSPGRSPTGLAWDGRYIWSCDADAQKIYMHNPESYFRVIKTFPAPGTAPSGLLWDGDTLWSCDSDTDMIYRHRMDRKLSVASAYQPRDFQDGKDKLIGITWDGKYFWTVGEKSGRFYRHTIHDMVKQ